MNMSLAAQFSKKKIKRRQRVGLSIIQANGEKKSLSLNNDQRKENKTPEIDRDSNTQNDAKKDNTFAFNFEEAIETTSVPREDVKNETTDGNQETQFSFGFEFKEESQKDSKEGTISKSKKRRNRKKKKQKHDPIETDQKTKERSNSMKPPPGLSSPDPQRKSLFDSLRTPPGFDRSVLYNQSRIRRTPGTHPNGSNNDEESSLYFDNTTKGLAFVNHNSLSARHDRMSLQNSSFFKSDPFSFGFSVLNTRESPTVRKEDIGTEAVNIKFNKASNLAYVNQNSLAVRQERTESKRYNQEHDPFSFGFSLDTLLKDYL